MPDAFSSWWETYKPVRNHLDGNPGGPSMEFADNPELSGARMFETYGPELKFVMDQVSKDASSGKGTHVWTVLDCDGHQIIASGYHLVNRMGYFITEEAFDGDFMEIDMDEGMEERYAVMVNDDDAYPADFENEDDAKVAAMHLQLAGDGDESDSVRIEYRRYEDGICDVVDDGEEFEFHAMFDEFASDIFPITDWESDVRKGDTKLGYPEWVRHNVTTRFKDADGPIQAAIKEAEAGNNRISKP